MFSITVFHSVTHRVSERMDSQRIIDLLLDALFFIERADNKRLLTGRLEEAPAERLYRTCVGAASPSTADVMLSAAYRCPMETVIWSGPR